MKKLTSFGIIVLLMLFLGVTSIAEARKGDSSKASKTSKTSTSSRSKTTSSTDSAFERAAKTKQTKVAWQERNKKPVEQPTVATHTPSSVNGTDTKLQEELAELKYKIENEKNHRKADKLEKQLAAIERQIAETKRQQQLIAIAETAAQAVLNKRNTTVSTQTPRVDSYRPAPNTSVPRPVEKPADSGGGGGWFVILLLIGGAVVVFFWLRKSNASTTIYRL